MQVVVYLSRRELVCPLYVRSTVVPTNYYPPLLISLRKVSTVENKINTVSGTWYITYSTVVLWYLPKASYRPGCGGLQVVVPVTGCMDGGYQIGMYSCSTQILYTSAPRLLGFFFLLYAISPARLAHSTAFCPCVALLGPMVTQLTFLCILLTVLCVVFQYGRNNGTDSNRRLGPGKKVMEHTPMVTPCKNNFILHYLYYGT